MQVKRQLRDSKLRQQTAVRRLNKIQKDLKNVQQDNLELEALVARLLQQKLLESAGHLQEQRRQGGGGGNSRSLPPLATQSN